MFSEYLKKCFWSIFGLRTCVISWGDLNIGLSDWSDLNTGHSENLQEGLINVGCSFLMFEWGFKENAIYKDRITQYVKMFWTIHCVTWLVCPKVISFNGKTGSYIHLKYRCESLVKGWCYNVRSLYNFII